MKIVSGVYFILMFYFLLGPLTSASIADSIMVFLKALFVPNPKVMPRTGEINYEIPCGVMNNSSSFSNRIVGGADAEPHEFPWIASLQVKMNNRSSHNCGGAVINSLYILTAAHCTMDWNPKELIIAVGKYNLQEKEPTEQYRNVSKVILNSFDVKNFNRDIALLKLDKPLNLIKSVVAPICIPNGNKKYSAKAIVAGWGRLSEAGLPSNTLKKVVLPILNKPECDKFYISEGYKSYLDPCQICTLDNDNKDACQGDSGGPLMCWNEDENKVYVCGLVSWGRGCARKNTPGVYTDVSCYTDWIKKQINDA